MKGVCSFQQAWFPADSGPVFGLETTQLSFGNPQFSSAGASDSVLGQRCEGALTQPRLKPGHPFSMEGVMAEAGIHEEDQGTHSGVFPPHGFKDGSGRVVPVGTLLHESPR